jgi:hypothetical protein
MATNKLVHSPVLPASQNPQQAEKLFVVQEHCDRQRENQGWPSKIHQKQAALQITNRAATMPATYPPPRINDFRFFARRRSNDYQS